MIKQSVISIILFCSLQFACFAPGSGGGTFRVLSEVASADRQWKAVLWSGMGGGAAGWCNQHVSIIGTSENLVFEKEPEKNRIPKVFSASCSSEVTLTWMDDTLVKIGYTIGKEKFGVSVSQKAVRTEDGLVQIVYEITDQ
jgi:hypothetical protein